MAEPILLLRLEGPLQSWGTHSRWDVRDTALEPTKSGVIGLIGCAMGLGRADAMLEELDRRLLFGVRADRPGLVSTDFLTVTGYHRTATGEFRCAGNRVVRSFSQAQKYGEYTVVSPRDYLHDASFLVALAVRPQCEDEHCDLLHHLADSLKEPKWPLYLGRKSCVPSRPILVKLTCEYPDLESALCHPDWTRDPPPPASLEAWVESDDGDFERQDAMRVNRFRFYDFRRCKRIEIDTTREPWEVRR